MTRPMTLRRRLVPAAPAARALAAIWILGAGLAASIPRAFAAGAGAYRVIDTWPAPAARPADAWRHAAGIAHAGGALYVADRAAARVTRAVGDTIVTIAQGEPLVAPAHLAIDEARGRLYVADPGAKAIHVLRLEGGLVDSWTGWGTPAGLAVAPDGSVVVARADAPAVHRLSPGGRPLASWAAGAGVGPPATPDPAPTAPASLLASGLRGVDVGRDGRVYVVSERGRAVQVYGPDGVPAATLRPPPSVLGMTDVAVIDDPRQPGHATLWLGSNQGLLRYDDRAGGWEARAAGAFTAVAVVPSTAPAPEWGVVATRAAERKSPAQVIQFDARGRPVGTWGADRWAGGSVEHPERLRIGADGGLVLLDQPARVQRVSLEGSFSTQIDHPLPGAIDADAGPDGTIYATDGQSLRAFAPGGAMRWMRDVAGGGDAEIVGLVFDRRRGMVLALDNRIAAVRRFTPGGAAVDLVPLPSEPGTPEQLAAAWSDIDVDADGALYALDRANRRAERVGPDGARDVIALDGPARRLAAGPDGRVWTLDLDGWVRAYRPDGTRFAAFHAGRLDRAGDAAPADLAVDGSGDVYVADRRAEVVSRWRWDPAAALPPAVPERSERCRIYPDKTARPERVTLGETVTVRLSVRAGCGAARLGPPLDVVLALDTSSSMRGGAMTAAQDAARALVDTMDLGVSRVGVVWFNSQAGVVSPLTGDEGRLGLAIANLAPMGGTRVDLGLAAARAELSARRRATALPVVALLTDGLGATTAEAMLREAEAIKAGGIALFTIGLGDASAPLAGAATSAEHAWTAADEDALAPTFRALGARLTQGYLLRRLDVRDSLPANMRELPASARPPAAWEPGGRTMAWSLADVPLSGAALTYRLEPLEPGQWPTNGAAWGDFADGADRPGRLVFPVPTVVVDVPGIPPPSPTAAVPSATPIATPAAAPSATRSPPPTPATPAMAPSATPTSAATASPPEPTPVPSKATGRQVRLPVVLRGAVWATAAPPPCPTEEAEPNDLPEQALARPAPCAGVAVAGRLAPRGAGPEPDADDYYHIEVPRAGTLIADLEAIPAASNFDLFVYDCNTMPGTCVRIGRSQTAGDRERVEARVPPGRYYLRVWLQTGSRPSDDPYRLRWTWRDDNPR